MRGAVVVLLLFYIATVLKATKTPAECDAIILTYLTSGTTIKYCDVRTPFCLKPQSNSYFSWEHFLIKLKNYTGSSQTATPGQTHRTTIALLVGVSWPPFLLWTTSGTWSAFWTLSLWVRIFSEFNFFQTLQKTLSRLWEHLWLCEHKRPVLQQLVPVRHLGWAVPEIWLKHSLAVVR